jgi:hypothetical protein
MTVGWKPLLRTTLCPDTPGDTPGHDGVAEAPAAAA